MIAALSFVAALYLWTNRGYSSGFVFTRLGFLSTNLQTGGALFTRYESFPFAAAFLGMFRTVLGTTVVEVAFLPIIPLVSLAFVYPLARLFVDDGLLAVLASLPVFLTTFLDTYHFTEYLVGRLFFLLFVFASVLYLTDDARHRRRFGFLAVAFYLGVKLFAPPVEMWAVTWVGFVVGFLTLGRILAASDRLSGLFDSWGRGGFAITRGLLGRAWILGVAVVVLFLAYNPKLYGQFLTEFGVSGANLAQSVEALAQTFRGGSGSTAGEYVAVEQSPRILQYNKLARYAVIAAATLLVPLYRFLRRGPGFLFRDARELLAVTLLATYLSDLLVYAAIGAGIQIRYVKLVFPIVAVYYYADVSREWLLRAALVVLLVTSVAGVGYEFSERTARPYVGVESGDDVVEWHQSYATSPRITTDHHSFGLLAAASGVEHRDPTYFDFVQLDRGMYASFADGSTSDSYALDYLIVNRETLDDPAMKGPPEWTYFEPLAGYVEGIENERYLQKVYESEEFVVYRSTPADEEG